MGFAQWMRVIDTIGNLAQITGRLRGSSDAGGGLQQAAGPGGALEARLAGVVVAALKEAFDRDSARMELERSHLEAERRRAEEALRAELRRQAGERALGQLRLIAVMAIGLWALSAALSVVLPDMRGGLPRALLGTGWLLAIGTLATAFAGWQHISRWSAEDGVTTLRAPFATAAPWLLIGALALTAASLLAAL